MAIFRTALLLGLLAGILLAVGGILAGTYGMIVALILAFSINFITYWFSDKIVLKMYRAKETSDKRLNSIVEKLSKAAGMPKPKVYIMDKPVPNAFATGRSPKHSAIAVTSGLMNNLNSDEIEGVLAHELSHIKNHDTLVSVMAATIGGAVAFLARMAWWGMIGGNRKNNSAVILLPLLIFAPLAAMLVQLAVSRTREYGADYSGALISMKPMALASALDKITKISKSYPIRGSPATAHMWIVNPFKADAFMRLFSTHPSTESRIEKLKELAKQL